jgi:hypothetical protein
MALLSCLPVFHFSIFNAAACVSKKKTFKERRMNQYRVLQQKDLLPAVFGKQARTEALVVFKKLE